MKFFATTPKGLELLLVEELKSLGAIDAAEKLAGVTFTGDLSVAYRACLWSRLANRILLKLIEVPAETPEELYAGVQNIAWDEHLDVTGTFNVNFISSHSAITHTLFGAQKVKDAIVDQFRQKFNSRPNVARDNPDVSVHVYLQKNIASISLDLSGESLHKRGYRLETGAAPLKENLAAAILMRAGWKKIVENGGVLLDPMCGSGTLLIEGALMAANIAPGLARNYFGFLRWKKHDAALWQNLWEEAQQAQLDKFPRIVGFDSDSSAIKVAFANIERAGLLGKVHVEKRELSELNFASDTGLLITNPPYGERLGEISELKKLYQTLGEKLKTEFVGWQAGVLTSNPELGKNMGLRSRKNYALFNGAIPCQLLLFDVQSEWFVDRSPSANNERRIRKAQKNLSDRDRELAQMFLNRLQKNRKHLKKWAERESISCYRIYDADLPEYAVSVDLFNQYVCVQEYQAPKSVDKEKAYNRLQQVLTVLPEALEIPASNIFLRERDLQGELLEVEEFGKKFLVDFYDAHFPVGLALEQRMLRALIQIEVKDKTFLHLFSHSGAMTVCAGLGGAKHSKTLTSTEFDLSWTRQNLALNGLDSDVVLADSSEWILKERLRYDIIFAELPAKTSLLPREYLNLIQEISHLLTPSGTLYFLTYDPRFKADAFKDQLQAEDITSKLIPVDFQRTPKIFQCLKSKND